LGSQASEVNITAEEWEQIKNSEAAARASEPITDSAADDETETADTNSQASPSRD